MAESGISWGKIALTGLGLITATVLAGPVLTGISETLAQNAANGSTLSSIASGAQSAASWITGNTSSILGAVGTNVTPEQLQNMNGVWGALSTTGQNAVDLASNNLPTTAAILGATAVAGAAIGEWTGKVGARPGGPAGGSYADMARARQMAMARAAGRMA